MVSKRVFLGFLNFSFLNFKTLLKQDKNLLNAGMAEQLCARLQSEIGGCDSLSPL
ncbi:MAG: hypothetical protein ACP5KK_00095 [Candidatus Nanoarchaeia archaeon]